MQILEVGIAYEGFSLSVARKNQIGNQYLQVRAVIDQHQSSVRNATPADGVIQRLSGHIFCVSAPAQEKR